MDGTVEVVAADGLYRRIRQMHLNADGSVRPNVFLRVNKKRREPDPEVCVDLRRFSTAEESANRGRTPPSGVLGFLAEIPLGEHLDVVHRPLSDNYAHAQIEGLDRFDNYLEIIDRMLESGISVVIAPIN